MGNKITKLQEIEAFFRENFRPLTVLAMQYVKEQAIAEDIVQDLFLYIYEKFENGGKDFPNKYFYTLVKYRCLNNLAHQKIGAKSHADLENLYSNPHDPLELVEFIELEHKYLQALECLPSKCRQVFEMSRSKGKSNKEIAEELNLSKRTVETHITHALKDIRGKLSEYLAPVMLLIALSVFIFKYESITNCFIL